MLGKGKVVLEKILGNALFYEAQRKISPGRFEPRKSTLLPQCLAQVMLLYVAEALRAICRYSELSGSTP